MTSSPQPDIDALLARGLELRALGLEQDALEVLTRAASLAQGVAAPSPDELELEHGIHCRLPLLEKVRGVPGWLTDAEADLLGAVVTCAAPRAAARGAALVELGSYCGRSTLAIALSLRATGHAELRLTAVDPHDGYEFAQGLDTHAALLETLRHHGVGERVDVVRAHSWELAWSRPVAFLFIDALHDYADVRRDFDTFEPWLEPDALVAFHDHSAAFPGVTRVVGELVGDGWSLAARRGGLAVLVRAR